MRREYEAGGLGESDAGHDPFALFDRWFTDARAGVEEANAMVVGTVGAGRPSSRTVLLKGYDAEGLTFFTNYESRKGVELAADPRCAVLFPWYALQRQVRVEGVAAKVSEDESAAYFASRPRESQLGAWASAQSRSVRDRDELEATYDEVRRRFEGADVPRPPFWGGYRITPLSWEFWQGRRGRMHDRIAFELEGGVWTRTRLAP